MSEQPSAISRQPSAKNPGADQYSRDQGVRIAIIAAMEREVAPLIRDWKIREVEHAGRRYRFFEHRNAVLICGGIGAEAARRATEAVIQKTRPELVLSVGYAGALDSRMKVADVFQPGVVVNAADGARAETGAGQGTLVSYAAVADPDQKKQLANAYAAVAVDMEAGAVWQGAQAHGIRFAALKAISEEPDFVMPPLEEFVEQDGRFCMLPFVMHVTTRPRLWRLTLTLARNSAKASRTLCRAIEGYLERYDDGSDSNS